MKIIIDGIKEVSGDNILDLTIYIAAIILFIWLFKEFRIKLIEEQKTTKEKESDVLIDFIDLEFELKQFINDKSNFDKLREKLTKIYPNLSYQLSKKVSNFRLEMENDEIKEFLEGLVNEKNNIKYNQLNGICSTNENSFFKMMEQQYKTKFLALVEPLLLALFSILIIITFILIMIGYSSIDSSVAKYFITQAIINILFCIILVIGILETLINKKFINKKSTWIYLFGFFLATILLFIFFNITPAVSTIVFIYYIIFIINFPKLLNRN